MRDRTRQFFQKWPDFLVLIFLCLVVMWGWCSGNGTWTISDWKLPTAYLDPVKGDVIFHLALVQASQDGHFFPFFSKTVPQLGAPGQANWNDWPIVEEFPVFLVGMLARVTGIFAGLNIMLLAGHVLAAITLYLVARCQHVSRGWSFVGGLAFGLAPYLFAQSPHHPFVQLCWHVPLFLLVWQWVSCEPGIRPLSGHFWFGMAVGFLSGLQMIYYTGIFCQLVLLGALVVFWRTRKLAPLISAGCFVAAAAFAFGLMNLDTWLYRLGHGPNPGALVREYKWLEIYGLKIVDLFIPPVVHQWDAFRNFAEGHATRTVLQDEGSYLGLFGAASLLLLAWTAISAVVRRHPEKIPMEAWQVLWIILFFGTGGLNAISGLFGVTMFRAACRYSIVIMAIALLFSVQHLSKWTGGHKIPSLFAVGLLSILILWDQVPRSPGSQEREAIASQVQADREMMKSMESALPPGAMVFQIPVMDFPESPAPGVPSYDHLRPYLYSKNLRFSFGSNKGRADGRWQHELARMSLPDAVREIQNRGFSALYINRNGFPDKGKAIEDTLRSLGHSQVINSQKGDLVCIVLNARAEEPPIKLFP